MSSIGERIKIRRKEIGMSAKELGEIIGKTESTIFRYEKDVSATLIPTSLCL